MTFKKAQGVPLAEGVCACGVQGGWVGDGVFGIKGN